MSDTERAVQIATELAEELGYVLPSTFIEKLVQRLPAALNHNHDDPMAGSQETGESTMDQQFLGYDEMGAPVYRQLALPPGPGRGRQMAPRGGHPGYGHPGAYGGMYAGIPNAAVAALAQQQAANCRVRPNIFGQTNGRQFIGFPQILILAGVTVDIIRHPQRPLQPKRLIIPTRTGPTQPAGANPGDSNFAFAVVDLKIGNASQFNATGELPASTFSENSTYVEQDMDAAFVGNDVTLTIRNTDLAFAHNFAASLVGDACSFVPVGGYQAGMGYVG